VLLLDEQRVCAPAIYTRPRRASIGRTLPHADRDPRPTHPGRPRGETMRACAFSSLLDSCASHGGLGVWFLGAGLNDELGCETLSIGLGVSAQVQDASVMSIVNLELRWMVSIPGRISADCEMGCAFCVCVLLFR
jgi:hypothetical protein